LSSLEPGTLVGRYRVNRLIAQGGMAEVYHAEQALAGDITRPVALKVIRPEYSESTDFREMFLDEARTACTLSHPNIVHTYEVGEDKGMLYMAMELVPGAPLSVVARALASRGERLTDEALLAVGIHACAALEAVHAHQGLVHRDVSPQNILLSPRGQLKLIDFGIAQAATNRNMTQAGTTKGKAGYFSPEQAMGKKLDGRSDLFSLGVTLYQLAAGTTPLDVSSKVTERHAALVKGKWEPLERVCPGLPQGFYNVVSRALQVRPEDRYPDAAAMREDLEAVALAQGLAVGLSSLAGYVQEQSGAFTVIPTGVKRQRGSGIHVPNVPSRTKVPTLLARQQVRAALGVVTALAMVGGGFAVWKLWLAPSPMPSKDVVAVVTPPPSPAEPAPPVKAGEPVAANAPPPAASEPSVTAEDLIPLNSPAEAKPARERPRRPSRPPSKPVASPAPVVEKPAEPEPEPEDMLKGEGTLRIRTTAQGSVAVKLPGLGRVALPVLNHRIAAGRHTAEFFLEGGGTARCTLTVRPDRRTIVTFNGKTCSAD
jgi:serine/threonine-protein kinase